MAKITDPDLFVRSTTEAQLGIDGNIWIDSTTLSISMKEFTNLSSDGVTIQAIYSYLKDEWKSDPALIKFPFPMVPITPEQFEFVDSWQPADQTTVDLFRDGGFAIKNGDGTSAEEYVGVITLGSIGGSDQVYFQQVLDGASAQIVLTGAVNQCVKVFGDGGTHGIDNASSSDTRSYFKIFVREYQKLYSQSELLDIGVTTFTYQAYRFPLANADDLKITHTDTEIDADSNGVADTGKYADMNITYYATPQSRTIGASNYDFDVIIDADVANDGSLPTAEEIYEFVQWSLRQDTDIDADGIGVVNGKTASSLLTFVGDTLVTSQGVFIDQFSDVDINRIEFYDNSNILRTFPFVAAGVINFNVNLSGDVGAVYRMFFTDANGNNFGDTDAIIVKDNIGNDIAGNIPEDASNPTSIQFTFDYDGNVQGGRAAAQDAAVTVVAIGLDKAQYVKATSTIGRTNANSVSLVASLERNYSNPA